jgi:hypothetical protein
MTAYKKQKEKTMKKIILGIITILLAFAIFGCGKTAAGSGGGGGNGGGTSPSTFTVSGVVQAPDGLGDVQASLPRRVGRALASLFVSRAYAVNAGNAVSGAPVKAYVFGTETLAGETKTDEDGKYSLTLDEGKTYELVAQYKAAGGQDVTLKNLTHKDAPATANISPVSTLAAELLKALKANPEVGKSLGNSEALNTLLSMLMEIAGTKSDEAEALATATGDTRDTQIDTVKSAVNTQVEDSAKAANAVFEYYNLPVKDINIGNDSFADWDDVPVVWQNVKEEWGAPGDVAEREGGLIKTIRYAKSNDGKKLYYYLKLKDGEYFANDGQYGLGIYTREFIENEDEDKIDHTKSAIIHFDRNQFYASRSDAVEENTGAHDPKDEDYDPSRAVTAKYAKSLSGTGFLEVEIDINSLKSVLPSDTFGEGKYQARITSSLKADPGKGGSSYRYITRTPILMFDLGQ